MTREQYAKLTDEEKNEKVREYTKWLCSNCGDPACVGCDFDNYPENVRPDYLNDLNACHEAEKMLWASGKVCAYEERLDGICGAKPTWMAKAGQLCEAFVLTMEAS